MMTNDARRLFFALWPGRALRTEFVTLRDDLHAQHGGKRVPDDNLHLTLAFVGSVAGDAFACIEAAGAAVQAPAFTLHMDRVGYFRRPKVVWVGAGEIPVQAEQLVEQLNRALSACGVQLDRRPFKAHATLLRKVKRLRAPLPAVSLDWTIDRFALVQSMTYPEGAQYTVLREWPLSGNNDAPPAL